VTATVTNAGVPVVGKVVSFSVSGVNAGVTGTCVPSGCTTNSSGQVAFTYTDANGAGTDTIKGTVTVSGVTQSATATETWVKVQPGLAADPYVADVAVGPTIYLTPSAHLTSGGKGLAGRTVTFTADKQVICSAVTDTSGLAKCSGTLTGVLQVVLNPLGYQATFAGDAFYMSATAKGNLISINGKPLV
jgi:hypothetical protein